MSTIEKLSIQGIRSFGAKAEDVQCISFSSPVTLILGENGCGKTTIIECLKYALTGECPPGSDRGKNFVHDPKIFGLFDSLGQIKLQVRNLKNEQLSVCRSMRISHRRNKFTFETLDSTVNYLGKGVGGETSSISKRCVDVDAVMCDFMGVSEAIIKNVLFCHQEDSSWPLDEPKKLKEKFDAIFGIVEHNKAVEKLMKMRKEKSEQLKVLEANLQFLVHLKQEMEDKTLNLEQSQHKCFLIKEEIKCCEDEIKPIDDRMAEILKVEYEMGKYQAMKVQLETEQKSCNEQIQNLSKKIKNFFHGDVEELNIEIFGFDEKMKEKQRQQSELQDRLTKLKSKGQTLQKSNMDLDRKRCLLIQQRQTEQECSAKRAEKIQEICSKLDLPFNEDLEVASQKQISSILEDIQNALLRKESQISEITAAFDREDQKLQTAIDDLRVQLTKLEENITTLENQLLQNKNESENLNKKIIEIERSTGRLKSITNDIKQLEARYESTTATFNQEERRKEIADEKIKIVNLQEQFRKLDERLTALNAMGKVMAEINLKEQELEKKEQEVRRVKNKHGDNLRRIVGKTLESNFRRTVQSRCEHMQQEIKDLNENLSAARLKEQSCEIKRKNLKDDLVRMEKELEECKEKIFEKCHSKEYEDLLANCMETISKYQIEYSGLRSAEAMYKRYIKKIEEDPSCPLCHRNMSSNEAADISSELSDEIHQLPANISRSEKLLKAEQAKYESLLQLRPVIEKVSQLEVDIPKRKEELKTIQSQLSECASQNESLQMALVEPNANYMLANSMLGDMSILDEAIKDVSRLNESIQKLKSRLPKGFDTSESAEDLQIEKSTVAAELADKRSDVDRMQTEYEKLVDKLNELREKKNALKDEQIKLQEGVQSLPQLKERQTELVGLLKNATNKLKESKGKVQPLKQELCQTLSEKSRAKEANRKKIIEMKKDLDDHKSIDQDIQRLNREVQKFEKLQLENELKELKEQIINCKKDMDRNNASYSAATIEFDDIKTECIKQETLKRDLKDNRDLKLLQQQNESLAEDLEKLKKQVGDLDFRKAVREKNSLNEKRDKITLRKSELLGQMGEINNQIRKLEIEINEPKYKESMQNYKAASYKVHVKRALIADLGRCRVALEWALIQFHAEKMQRINSLIREYWRLIYRGNDIDYIEIKTKDETETASTSDRRRSYNYRVIQSKHDSEIEMRGRCSAGQRVLASLIIRMALAETFSTNCGVLALDEPTTNLDRHNILSLCEALNRIVDERQTQSNFMLIIITHDEDFISNLGKIDSYHRVSRSNDGKSIIRKVRVV